MHIIIGVLTAAAGLIWALYRLQHSGVDLNAFNPFYWLRRRKWEKQLGTKALHRLERELRKEVTALYEKEFQIPHTKALELFAASIHLLREAGNLEAEVRPILAPCKSKLTSEQIASLMSMLTRAADFEPHAKPTKERFIQCVERELEPQIKTANGKW
jgi:hypothetical protein